MSRMSRWLILAAVLLALAVPAGAQFRGPARDYATDLEYDGRFTFVRLRWKSDLAFARRGWSTAWDHDYPRAEQHLSQIVDELTGLDIRMDGSLILTLDDPQLFKYPVAFMWEPGFWNLTDREAESFRAYLLKGGFAVFEDFDGPQQWNNFEAQMRRVLPDGRFVKLDENESHLRRVLQDPGHQRHRPSDVPHPPELLRRLRGQRSVETADGRRQLRQRRARILGVVRRGACSRSTRRTKPTSWASTT